MLPRLIPALRRTLRFSKRIKLTKRQKSLTILVSFEPFCDSGILSSESGWRFYATLRSNSETGDGQHDSIPTYTCLFLTLLTERGIYHCCTHGREAYTTVVHTVGRHTPPCIHLQGGIHHPVYTLREAYYTLVYTFRETYTPWYTHLGGIYHCYTHPGRHIPPLYTLRYTRVCLPYTP